MNLTAVRDEEYIVIRHFGESFFAARKLIGREEVLSAIDVGSGAGFPGIPMKMMRPQIAMELVEAHGKKTVFLREVLRELQLTNVKVTNTRVETLIADPNQPRRELVTLRAVEKFRDILPSAAQLASHGGRLGLLLGEDQVMLAEQILAGKWEEPIKIPRSERRTLAIWRHR
jgi:16S rRNA (guanine527-N7)-methyltransferase